jgi:hypothetical protein
MPDSDARANPLACRHCALRFKWRSSLKTHQSNCSWLILEQARRANANAAASAGMLVAAATRVCGVSDGRAVAPVGAPPAAGGGAATAVEPDAPALAWLSLVALGAERAREARAGR